MRKLWMAAAAGAALAGPAAAQSLNDAGRLLQQVMPGQQQQQQPSQGQSDRDRAIYEQGRRDAQQGQRRGGENRVQGEDQQPYERSQGRRRGDPDQSYDQDRAPRVPGQYQPYNNQQFNNR